ncbi:hypothetical protein F4680DRAFT_465271 [Xylaria scruposa]|nr:hypothetical protein F4680DRAFT_465271 [Xylaria scruposa]
MSLRLGRHLLHEPASSDTTIADVIEKTLPVNTKCVSIVFVHGLGGGHLSTWSQGNIEYDSKIMKVAESTSRTSIAGHAQSLLNDLQCARRTLRVRIKDFIPPDIEFGVDFPDSDCPTDPAPLMFVCHSLGGLVVKQALIRPAELYHNQHDNCSQLGLIYQTTRCAIFLGTPHRGSSKASIGKVAASAGKILGGNIRMLRVLRSESEVLEQQRELFDTIRRPIMTVCFWEELSVLLIGLIVPQTSACIDGPDVLKEQIPGVNHHTMAKFSSRLDKGYLIIPDYLRRSLRSSGTNSRLDMQFNSQINTDELDWLKETSEKFAENCKGRD